jgi:glycogen debranching enzyme
MDPDSFSGWGVRTLAAGEVRYNPMAYHNGTVWPHDNALIAHGFSRYGLQDLAVRLLGGLFEAGTSFELHRMPELFCGFTRQAGEGPTPYPVACAPQAWAAGAVFLLLQACLGLGISAVEPRIWFTRPQLPAFLGQITITNLSVAGVSVDLQLTRHDDDVGVRVLRRDGAVEILIAK